MPPATFATQHFDRPPPRYAPDDFKRLEVVPADKPMDVFLDALMALLARFDVQAVPVGAVLKACRLRHSCFQMALRDWISFGIVAEGPDGCIRVVV